jgi:Uncharacterized conserved protein
MDTTDEQPAGEAASTDSEAGGDAAGANNTDTNQLDGVSGRSTDGNATDEKRSETPAGLDWPTGPYADYDTTQVTVRSDDKAAASVRAAIADTAQTRYTGLSNATALPDGAGMLFVFTDEGDRTFVMREMDFGLDIIYANADRTITSVHHADAPGPNEDGNEQDYPGYGQYVLEVPQFWTDRNNITVGGRISFTL